MEAIDAVVKPLIDSAVGAGEKAATVGLDAIGGVVLFIFASRVPHTFAHVANVWVLRAAIRYAG